MKNYVSENLSSTSLTTVKRGLKAVSNGTESIIFLFLGISTVTVCHEWNTAFVLLTVLFCTLYRALSRSIESCLDIDRRLNESSTASV